MSGEIELIQGDGVVQNRKASTSTSIPIDIDIYQKIRPPTYSIPDEYLHNDNKLGLVIIFTSSADSENAKLIQKELIYQNYSVPSKNIFQLSTRQDVLNQIDQIASQNHSDKTCLILIMFGTTEQEGEFLPEKERNRKGSIKLKEIFTPFTGDKCPSFRNKPKIFIFQSTIHVHTQQTDTVDFTPTAPSNAYQVPTEADILLIYNHVEEALLRHTFIEDLCNNFRQFGQMDDIVGLVIDTDYHRHKRPLLISTLTRRFYITSSTERGHDYEFYITHDTTINMLQNIYSKIPLRNPFTNSQVLNNILSEGTGKVRGVPKDQQRTLGSPPKVNNTKIVSKVDSSKTERTSNNSRGKKKSPPTNRPPWR